jgi:hypothetical protein
MKSHPIYVNLAIFVAEMTVDCEDCGYEIPLLKSDFEDPPDLIICSWCQALIPPMIHIDTKDLPGFAHDAAAKRVAEQLALFGKKPARPE